MISIFAIFLNKIFHRLNLPLFIELEQSKFNLSRENSILDIARVSIPLWKKQ